MKRRSERKPITSSGGVRLRPSTRAALRRTRLRLGALEGETLTTDDLLARMIRDKSASIRVRAGRRGLAMQDLDKLAGVEPEPEFRSPPARIMPRVD